MFITQIDDSALNKCIVLQSKKIRMPFEVFFDSPEFYKNKSDYYSCGSSPKLLEKLTEYLDNNSSTLSEVNIALYLFNNDALNKKLIYLSENGVNIRFFTIPIEGYDSNNPKEIIDINSRNVVTEGTKYQLAKNIFTGHYLRKYKNFELFFSHTSTYVPQK